MATKSASTASVPTQDMGATHEKDPTETTLEQPGAKVDEASRQEAADKRLARGAERDYTGTTREAASSGSGSASSSGSGSSGGSSGS